MYSIINPTNDGCIICINMFFHTMYMCDIESAHARWIRQITSRMQGIFGERERPN